MSCPSPETLVAIAFADDNPNDVAVRHVRTCGICTREVSRLREIASSLRLAQEMEPVADGCLDEMTIAAIASDSGHTLDTAATAHLAACAECREQLAGAIGALNAPEIREEIERVESRTGLPIRRRAHWTRIAAVAAGLAGLALVPQLFLRRDDSSVSNRRDMRDTDPTITMTVPPNIVAPRGSVARADTIIWTSVPGAARYGIRVFDHEGTVVWEGETNDTTFALPATVALVSGDIYLTQVEAHTSYNRSVESSLMEFRINKQSR